MFIQSELLQNEQDYADFINGLEPPEENERPRLYPAIAILAWHSEEDVDYYDYQFVYPGDFYP